MALRRAGLCLAGAAPLPPGLLRLGLPAAALEDVQRAALSGGPKEAFAWLVKQQRLKDDVLQRSAVEPLDACWRAVRAQEEVLPSWGHKMAAWEVECARLRAEHQERRRRREEEQGSRERPEVDEEVVKEEPLVLPIALPKPRLSAPGCYLWGEVGRGKTLMMDLFALSLQQPHGVANEGVVVRRAHFHDFMHGVHQRIGKSRSEGSRAGVSAVVDETAAGGPAVLCFDEFQITNIADATLIMPLFSELFTREVVLVATSNRPPTDLYKGGLNRELHMPVFVGALERRLHVHYLDAPVDYRAKMRKAEDDAGASSASSDFVLEIPGLSSSALLAEAFAAAAGGAVPGAQKLPVAWGRQVECASTANGVARFTFEELCDRPLSAEDYTAMVTKAQVHTFVVSGVPRFTLKLHNEARRFTNLVDTLYEHQCRLICSADAPLDELLVGMDRLCSVEAKPAVEAESFPEPVLRKHGDVSFMVSSKSPCRPDTFATAEADSEAGTSVVHFGNSGADSSESGDDGIVGVMAQAADSLRESGFAARRCASRLLEMGTVAYRAGHEARWRS
mmetsp:Transcript_82566/g.232361  ORF Transcript_82566/g.232361 Transcript_82566/m.232361 type:complete len:563 (-) Transcript_82566:24-1712(-)